MKKHMKTAVLLILAAFLLAAFAWYWLVPVSGSALIRSPEAVAYGRVEYISSSGTKSYELTDEDLVSLVNFIVDGKYKRVGVIGPKSIGRYTLYLQDAAKDYLAVLSITPSGRMDKMEFNGKDGGFLQYDYCSSDLSSILRLLAKEE